MSRELTEDDDPFMAECVISAFTIINAELVRSNLDSVKFYSDVAQWWQDYEERAKGGYHDSAGGCESRRLFCEWLDNYFP